MAADQWCLGWHRQPHVPNGGLHIATVTPYGRAVTLCGPCLRGWQADDDGGDR